jgi:diamine N-acetyltransferase
MHMRPLSRDEVELIWTIDRSEVHHHVYEVREGQLARVRKYFEIPGWRPNAVEKETAALFECFDRGGTFLGLFDGDELVGIGVLDSARVGRAHDQMQLTYLYVSRAYRGRGVGTQLFDAAASIAREAGASALYVSATPTENTVDFYLGRGCVLAREPDPRLLAAEPDDIHLIYPLSGTVTLRELTDANRDSVLAVRVAAEQSRFVGSVAGALEDAEKSPEAKPWYRAIFHGDEPVGFVMLSFDVTPVPGKIIGPWFLWKLLIDERHQRRGYGRAALQQVVEIVRNAGAAELLTSYVTGEGEPWPFYERFGFVPTGELDDAGEIILSLDLSRTAG